MWLSLRFKTTITQQKLIATWAKTRLNTQDPGLRVLTERKKEITGARPEDTRRQGGRAWCAEIRRRESVCLFRLQTARKHGRRREPRLRGLFASIRPEPDRADPRALPTSCLSLLLLSASQSYSVFNFDHIIAYFAPASSPLLPTYNVF